MKRFPILIGLLLLVLIGCGAQSERSSAPQPTPAPVQVAAPLPAPLPAPREVKRLTLLAAGDNLIHDVIYRQAAQRSGGGGYDFLPAYSAVEPLIQAAHVAVINQETILASSVAPVSSYPRFCSPQQLGEQLLELGFDVFTQANNHSYDQGAAGIRACMDFWDAHPAGLPVGLYRNQTERDTIRYTTVKGMRLAFLAATEQTNGLSLSPSATEGTFLLAQESLLRRQLAEARQNADFVVISVHWGVEGADWVTDQQSQLAQRLVQWGADLVLGTHPHVLQPCQTIPRADGSTGLVIYSLGNFISAQQGKNNMAGGLLEVTVEQQGDDHATITGHRLIPTVTQYDANYAHLRVLPLADYSQALAAAHGVNRYEAGFSMDYLTRLYQKIYPDCAVLPQAAPPRPSPDTQPPVTASTTATADAMLDALCKEHRVTGMSLAAFSGGKVVYTHSYGYANLEKKQLATENTHYRTASIAKAVTAMVAMELYDDGSLELDGDISPHTGVQVRNPRYPHQIITPRQLMTHTSGIVDTTEYYAAIEHPPFMGLSQLIRHNIFSQNAPGTTYVYSNLSGGLVGGVAGGVAKEPFWSLAHRRLFAPLGLSATYLSKELPQGQVASIYTREGTVRTFNPDTDGTAAGYYSHIPPGELFLLGQGDLYITAQDLAKLGMVLAGDGLLGRARILKPATVKLMNTVQFHAPAAAAGQADIYRGLGVQIFPELLPGRTLAGHQGSAYGMISGLFYEPCQGEGLAFLTNGCRTEQRDGVVYNINQEVTRMIYDQILNQ